MAFHKTAVHLQPPSNKHVNETRILMTMTMMMVAVMITVNCPGSFLIVLAVVFVVLVVVLVVLELVF